MEHLRLMRLRALHRGGWAGLGLLVSCTTAAFTQPAVGDPGEAALAKEVATRGWILFSAKTAQGDYDLFVCRPDGSARRNLTRTPDLNEFGGRFSPDSKRMLYRCQARAAGDAEAGKINHDLWGARGALVIANADGSEPQRQGDEGVYPWASWSPDGTRIACLYKREGQIRCFDLATKKQVSALPSRGVFQQMFWSPDGKRLCGTANLSGQNWNIVSLELGTGQLTLLTRSLNCTPDWFQGDPNRVIYSCRMPGLATEYGWTMLMQATADGKSRTLICGERGRHLYYGCTSPDDKYVVFSRPESDGGTDANMAIVRLADTPIVVPEDYGELRSLFPKAKSGPVLHLQQVGFEPQWTYAEIGVR
jgi:Tol biopolymer transport system component